MIMSLNSVVKNSGTLLGFSLQCGQSPDVQRKKKQELKNKKNKKEMMTKKKKRKWRRKKKERKGAVRSGGTREGLACKTRRHTGQLVLDQFNFEFTFMDKSCHWPQGQSLRSRCTCNINILLLITFILLLLFKVYFHQRKNEIIMN